MITNEQKQEILALYADKSVKARDIITKYHISGNALTKIIIEGGGELRRPRASLAYRQKIHKCPKCGEKIDIVGARFCYNCGCDIRTERDLIIESLKKLHELTETLPCNDRDNFRDTINREIAFIRKESK